jgi:uncharacterized C2H2 Zn-finger protein
MLHQFIKAKNCLNVKYVIIAVHIKVTQINKSFTCEICDYSFSQKGNMNNHIASVHNGKKLLKCVICNATFTQKSNLKKHVLHIHEEKLS